MATLLDKVISQRRVLKYSAALLAFVLAFDIAPGPALVVPIKRCRHQHRVNAIPVLLDALAGEAALGSGVGFPSVSRM